MINSASLSLSVQRSEYRGWKGHQGPIVICTVCTPNISAHWPFLTDAPPVSSPRVVHLLSGLGRFAHPF